MRNLFKWLARWREPEFHETALEVAEHGASEVRNAYRELVARELARWDIDERAVAIEIRRDGHLRGVASFVAVVHLLEWKGMETLPLLLGLPFLERRLRRVVQSHWLADVSSFSGLWLHAPERMLAAPGIAHLRELLVGLTNRPVQDSIPGPQPYEPRAAGKNSERIRAALHRAPRA